MSRKRGIKKGSQDEKKSQYQIYCKSAKPQMNSLSSNPSIYFFEILYSFLATSFLLPWFNLQAHQYLRTRRSVSRKPPLNYYNPSHFFNPNDTSSLAGRSKPQYLILEYSAVCPSWLTTDSMKQPKKKRKYNLARSDKVLT